MCVYNAVIGYLLYPPLHNTYMHVHAPKLLEKSIYDHRSGVFSTITISCEIRHRSIAVAALLCVRLKFNVLFFFFLLPSHYYRCMVFLSFFFLFILPATFTFLSYFPFRNHRYYNELIITQRLFCDRLITARAQCAPNVLYAIDYVSV